MKNFIITLFSLFLFFPIASIAQETGSLGCGTEGGGVMSQRFLEIRKEMKGKIIPRDDISYIPIRFWLIANTAGEGRVSVSKVKHGLCVLNNLYSTQNTNIQFYIKEMVEINNNFIYDHPSENIGFSQIKSYCNANYDAINVFIVNVVGTTPAGQGAAGRYTGPDWPPNQRNDFITILKSYIDEQTTLGHEIGHYLSLQHPFNGWDSTPWNADTHGNPVTITSAPDGIPVELVNGTNCLISGDFICGTKPDYFFAANASGCSFSTSVHDPNNELITNIPISNIMNYFFNCSDYNYTDDQIVAMHNSLNGQSREYLGVGSYSPTLITASPELTSPEIGAAGLHYDHIELNWTDVEGATDYLVQVSLFQSFGSIQFEKVVQSSHALMDESLSKNKKFYWRVIPFNSYNVCNNYISDVWNFYTGENGVGTKEITFVKSFSIKPNPVNSKDKVIISLNTSKSFTGSISLIDISGKQISRLSNRHFLQGNNNIEYPVDNVDAGIYFMSIISGEGILNKKLVILE